MLDEASQPGMVQEALNRQLLVGPNALDGTRVLQDELRAVGRHVGSWYSNATDLFAIDRPA